MVIIEAAPDAVEIDVNDVRDEDRDIRYLGRARKGADGVWTCLADVAGGLCRVELSVQPILDARP